MQKLLNLIASCIAALFLHTGVAYAQATTIEVYKSPT